MTTPRSQLQPGGRYLIRLEDCCVAADLIGRFEGPADDDDDYPPLVFDIGTFTDTGQVTFTEIGDGP